MKHLITKTDYLSYLECPRYAWLLKHRKDLCDNDGSRRLSEQGEQVELLAR